MGETAVKKQLHLIIVFCTILSGCKSSNLIEGGDPPLLPEIIGIKQIINDIKPYDQINKIKEKVSPGFFQSNNAEKLVEWVKDGFYFHKNINDTDRAQYFYGLDLAAVASDSQKYLPLYQLKIESEINVIYDLISSVHQDELVLYKLYNEGLIIRTRNLCVGIDIILSPENNSIAGLFADCLDGLLITHSDWDHYDTQSELIPSLKNKNKPVILPADDSLTDFGGVLDSGSIKDLEWTAFKGGHLDRRFTSFFLIKIKNWRILHSGDNTTWLNFVNSRYAQSIDFFFFKPESIELSIEEMLERIHARYVIPHHLLELTHNLNAMGHDMGLRVISQAKNNSKVIMLQWGEKLSLSSDKRKGL